MHRGDDCVRRGFFRRASLRIQNLLEQGVAFDLGGDLVHHRHRFDRIAARRGLGRQHHRVRALEHRGRHVGNFGARRLRHLDHRFQHLCCHHHRLARLARFAGDEFLFARHRLQRQFHTQIAARHHQRIGEDQNIGQSLNRARLLDLGQNGGAPRHHLAQFGNIFGPLYEGQCHPVDAEIECGIEIAAILRRHCRNRQFRIGQVHTLAVFQGAALFDNRLGTVAAHAFDAQPESPVIDQHLFARRQGCEHFGVRNGNGARSVGLHLADQANLCPHRNVRLAAAERAKPDLGALQIDQNADRPLDLAFQRAQPAVNIGQGGARGVAHIDSEDIGARFEQSSDLFGRR